MSSVVEANPKAKLVDFIQAMATPDSQVRLREADTLAHWAIADVSFALNRLIWRH